MCLGISGFSISQICLIFPNIAFSFILVPMTSSFRMFRKLTVVLYVCIPLITITTLYTFWFHPNRPPRYSDLALRPLLGSSEPLPVSEFSSLRHLCDETDWTEGLWLQCHSNVGPSKTSMRGGLSNLENRMQTCVRLAIAAGAGVIVICPFSYSPLLRASCPAHY